jgi:dihydrofolate synthase / folylpolyglutamate synthase
MTVTPYRTHKIAPNEDIFVLLDKYVPHLEEQSIVVVTSKVISLCQGDVVKDDGKVDKKELIKGEAEYYFEDKSLSRFGTVIPTIKGNILVANAGVDESNADGYFILWPKHLEETTENIWKHLREKRNIRELGVVITDSRLTPLLWGITGVGISWCGFEPLKDYRGKQDLFGRELKMSQESIVNGLAAAAVVTMGEGQEQTPLAVITDVSFVTFQDRPPTKEERASLKIALEDDIYGRFLTSVDWQKGGGG